MTKNNAVVLAYLRKSDEDKHGKVQLIEKQGGAWCQTMFY